MSRNRLGEGYNETDCDIGVVVRGGDARGLSGDLSGVIKTIRRRNSLSSEVIAEQMRKELKRKDNHEKHKGQLMTPGVFEVLNAQFTDDTTTPSLLPPQHAQQQQQQDDVEEKGSGGESHNGEEKDREKIAERDGQEKKQREEEEYQAFLLMNASRNGSQSKGSKAILYIGDGGGPARTRSATAIDAIGHLSPNSMDGRRISPRRLSPRNTTASCTDLPPMRQTVSDSVAIRTVRDEGKDSTGAPRTKKEKKNKRKKEKKRKEKEADKKEKSSRRGSFLGLRRSPRTKTKGAGEAEKSLPLSLSLGMSTLSPRTPRGPGMEGMLKLGALMHLNLSNNGLSCIPQEFDLKAFTSLNKLSLEGNAFVTLPDDLLSPLSVLATLEVSNNHLSNLDCVCERTSLSEITARSNRLTHLPQSVGQLVNLKTLDLTDNQLQTLPESVSSLQNLKTLLLAKNKLESLPSGFSAMYGSFLFYYASPYTLIHTK